MIILLIDRSIHVRADSTPVRLENPFLIVLSIDQLEVARVLDAELVITTNFDHRSSFDIGSVKTDDRVLN